MWTEDSDFANGIGPLALLFVVVVQSLFSFASSVLFIQYRGKHSVSYLLYQELTWSGVTVRLVRYVVWNFVKASPYLPTCAWGWGASLSRRLYSCPNCARRTDWRLRCYRYKGHGWCLPNPFLACVEEGGNNTNCGSIAKARAHSMLALLAFLPRPSPCWQSGSTNTGDAEQILRCHAKPPADFSRTALLAARVVFAEGIGNPREKVAVNT